MAVAGRHLGKGPLALLGLVAVTAACGAPPGAELCAHEPELLAQDPVHVALEIQDTVRLDEQLVADVAVALDRARTIEPHLYRVHAYPPYVPNRLFLWATRPQISAAWARGTLVTGVADLDELLAEYSAIEVEPVVGRPDNFTLTFAGVLNIPLLLARFSEVEGIAGSVLWMYGDSDNIHAVQEADGWRLTFVLGWGDCPAGCIYHHWWEVFVSDDGSDAFLTRERGESAEWFMDCVPVIPGGESR